MKNYYEFVYARYIESDVYYAVKIIDSLTLDLATFDPERYFLDSQLCLNLVTNIANVLDSRVKTERSAHLLEYFNISVDKIKLILNRDMRNTNEHYDERMDALMEISNVELGKKDVDNIEKLISVLQSNGKTGYADVDKCVLYSLDRKLNRIEIDLLELRDELFYIIERIHAKIREVKHSKQ